MSYRLITRATLTVTNAAGATITRELDVRTYPSPKREAAGMLTLDGASVAYKRTGGKGRGTADRRYAYFPMGTESAYIEITEAEATAFVGGQVTITRVAKAADPALVATPAAPTEAPAPTPAPKAAAPKAPRRVKGQAKATTEA
jgi:hypothetical protein